MTTGPDIYETRQSVEQYLLFHYGEDEDQMPWGNGPTNGLHYPARCVSECLPQGRYARALDLGCSVGRSSFELSKTCEQVIGIDYSQAFIDAAEQIKEHPVDITMTDEGDHAQYITVARPKGVNPDRVHFEQGDACSLRNDLGTFDVILLANLIDRLQDPAQCLRQLSRLCQPGGWLIITSPYTWLEDYTPREKWLSQPNQTTLEGLKSQLAHVFDLQQTKDLPFQIREHKRKFQWSVAQASLWQRRTD